MAEIAAALDQAAGVAPPEVRADIALIRDATKQYETLLSKAGYDVAKLERGAENPFVRPEVEAATERQATYAQ